MFGIGNNFARILIAQVFYTVEKLVAMIVIRTWARRWLKDKTEKIIIINK